MHERLRAHFAELVHPTIVQHRGRVVKNTGDGLLAEFVSVVDAVRCAVKMQQGVAERNSAIPRHLPEHAEWWARSRAVALFRNRKFADSPLEGPVRSEPVLCFLISDDWGPKSLGKQ
jgi:hypothetical protein